MEDRIEEVNRALCACGRSAHYASRHIGGSLACTVDSDLQHGRARLNRWDLSSSLAPQASPSRDDADFAVTAMVSAITHGTLALPSQAHFVALVSFGMPSFKPSGPCRESPAPTRDFSPKSFPHTGRTMKSLIQFMRDTRAGATAIAAASITVMSVMGASLIVDHVWLVGKRDVLKTAADAATVATTLRLRTMPITTDDATVETILQSVADRYVWINLKPNIHDDSLESSAVINKLDINRAAGFVKVTVDAPIGESLLSKVVGYYGPDQMHAESGADAGTGPVWAVLALDVSKSMRFMLDGRVAQDLADQRMGIVKAAAKDFVAEVLSVDTEATTQKPEVSIGVVPWSVSANGGVLAPTTTRSTIDAALDRLEPVGGATASSRGIKKSRELLAVAPEGTKRVIVLLTDGQDNLTVNGGRCENRAVCPKWRAEECTTAKTDGIAVFTIGAMKNTDGNLAQQLIACASSVNHAFINTRDVQAMYDTFDQIAGQLRPLRRTY